MNAFRITTAILSVACLAISFGLMMHLAYLGFAIGGWTGLKDYQQQILDARQSVRGYEYRLAVVQILGGMLSATAAAPRKKLRWYILSSPLFIIGFYIASWILFWTGCSIISELFRK